MTLRINGNIKLNGGPIKSEDTYINELEFYDITKCRYFTFYDKDLKKQIYFGEQTMNYEWKGDKENSLITTIRKTPIKYTEFENVKKITNSAILYNDGKIRLIVTIPTSNFYRLLDSQYFTDTSSQYYCMTAAQYNKTWKDFYADLLDQIIVGIDTDGKLFLMDKYNKMFLGTYTTLTQIGTDTDWDKLFIGKLYDFYFMSLIKTNGTMWGCGYNLHGQLGLPIDTYTTLTQIGTDNDWEFVSFANDSNNQFSIAKKTNGTIWGAGTNSNYQLGLGTNIPSYVTSYTQIGTSNQWIKLPYYQIYPVQAIHNGNILYYWSYYRNSDSGPFLLQYSPTGTSLTVENFMVFGAGIILYKMLPNKNLKMTHYFVISINDFPDIKIPDSTSIDADINLDIMAAIPPRQITVFVGNDGNVYHHDSQKLISCLKNKTSDKLYYSLKIPPKVSNHFNNNISGTKLILISQDEYFFAETNDKKILFSRLPVNKFESIDINNIKHYSFFSTYYTFETFLTYVGNDNKIYGLGAFHGSYPQDDIFYMSHMASHEPYDKVYALFTGCVVGIKTNGEAYLYSLTPTFYTHIAIDDWKYFTADYSTISYYGLRNNGELYSCGYNFDGQLGLGDNTDRISFQLVTGHLFQKVIVLPRLIIGIKSNGTIWGTGRLTRVGFSDSNVFIQLGTDNDWHDIHVACLSNTNYRMALLQKKDKSIYIFTEQFYNSECEFISFTPQYTTNKFMKIWPI